MSTTTAAAQTGAVNVPVWVWMVIGLAVGLLYTVAFDNGFVSSQVASSNVFLHELFHDGRHLFGVPCH